MPELYTFLLAFAKEHWFLVWCFLWIPVWALCLIIALVLETLLRSVTIWVYLHAPKRENEDAS